MKVSKTLTAIEVSFNLMMRVLTSLTVLTPWLNPATFLLIKMFYDAEQEPQYVRSFFFVFFLTFP
jgi:hypothetical protein